MADDTDDVVLARIALLDYHRQRGLLFPGMDERNQELHGLIDALIAAVRAELAAYQPQHHSDCAISICAKCGAHRSDSRFHAYGKPCDDFTPTPCDCGLDRLISPS